MSSNRPSERVNTTLVLGMKTVVKPDSFTTPTHHSECPPLSFRVRETPAGIDRLEEKP